MGGCNGWVFEGVKLAQANLLPMGLPHLVSQYSLSPTSPPAGLRDKVKFTLGIFVFQNSWKIFEL